MHWSLARIDWPWWHPQLWIEGAACVWVLWQFVPEFIDQLSKGL